MKKILISAAALSFLAVPAFAQTAQPLTQDQPVNNGGDATTATGSATNNSDMGTATTNYGGSASSATGGLNENTTTTTGGQGTGAGQNNAANTTGDNADQSVTGAVDTTQPLLKQKTNTDAAQ